jgi:hypothetical protein
VQLTEKAIYDAVLKFIDSAKPKEQIDWPCSICQNAKLSKLPDARINAV